MTASALGVRALELGPFAAHCLLVTSPPGREALVVDPGFEAEEVLRVLRDEGLQPTTIVLTHAHVDHACGAAAIKRAFPGARLLLHALDLPLYLAMAQQAAMFSLPEPVVVPHDGLLEDQDVLTVGHARLLVRHTPGHSPGHVVLVHEDPESPLVIVGDVLFAGGVGRTDLWGGSFEDLVRSIREVLYRLPDHTRVIPGHGEETTIGEERLSNPFVAE